MQRTRMGLCCARRFRRPFAVTRVSHLVSSLTSHHSGGRRCVSQDSKRSVAQLLQWKPAEKIDGIVVNGYVRSVRSMKAHRFVSLGDGSSLAALQALIPVDQAEGVAVGAAVRFTGSWVASPGGSQSHELHATKVEVLGPSDPKTFPIQKKYQTPEYLRTMPHLRPRTPVNAALLRLRSEAIASLTGFFADRAFTQTHPPIITSSDCEGAGEVFTLEPAGELSPESGAERAKEEFFRSKKYLSVSTQLHLEALAQSVGNVWTLSPVFRAEQSDTARHLSEFYMLEAEMSFVDDLSAIMDLAEDMLRSLGTNLFGSATVQELLSRPAQLGSDLVSPDVVRQRWEGLMQPTWPRITYSEAIDLLQQKSDLFSLPPTWGAGLQSEHEKYLAQHVGGQTPVFVTNYPRDIKAFYMRGAQPACPGATATVECFDLLVPELCEIAGGSMREHRLEPLMDAMKRQGMTGARTSSDGDPESAKNLDWYVDLRRWGCPPHGGFGVGFDRLLSYLAGVQTIRDIVAFPRWHGRCDC
ncbi:asparaginyl-tRNA synthetase [Podospora aff. communis PSN243]|uniref:asparagine--tRNA ligase n=1 Tax=Podospora aff. communis PSN243 TaxID=3040156 RepID=A0AAV9G9Z9_9PEZI|nr:asparaginyl-tRNA synthetase [Podospora aff. communis PSN243]